MGSDAETEVSSTPMLPLFSKPPMLSPEPSGMLTPPLHTSASVPFRWEEEPGRPRPCTALITLPNPNNKNEPPKFLELPPRLQIMESSKITKTPSPTTVLDGPYVGRNVFSSSSFRLLSSKRQDSFDNCSRSPERVQIGEMLLDKRSGHRGKGFFGSWGQKQKTLKLKGGKKEAGRGSFVFSSSSIDVAAACSRDESDSTKVKMAKIRRIGSFSSLSQARSHFWATMYEGFKQAIPWKSRKSKKEMFII